MDTKYSVMIYHILLVVLKISASCYLSKILHFLFSNVQENDNTSDYYSTGYDGIWTTMYDLYEFRSTL